MTRPALHQLITELAEVKTLAQAARAKETPAVIASIKAQIAEYQLTPEELELDVPSLEAGRILAQAQNSAPRRAMIVQLSRALAADAVSDALACEILTKLTIAVLRARSPACEASGEQPDIGALMHTQRTALL